MLWVFLQIQPTKYNKLLKNTLWYEVSYVSLCPSRKPSKECFSNHPPQILVPYVKVGSTTTLNRCALSSQHVTPTTVSFLKVPSRLSYLYSTPFTWWFKVAMGVEINPEVLIYLWYLFGPCIGRKTSWFTFLLLRPNIRILVLINWHQG